MSWTAVNAKANLSHWAMMAGCLVSHQTEGVLSLSKIKSSSARVFWGDFLGFEGNENLQETR